jgi:type IV secretory pathway protease TraF
MRELIHSLILFAVILLAVGAAFWIVKHHRRVVIEKADRSMAPDYEPGSYWLGPPPASASECEVGKAYAFQDPASPDQQRVAWLLAKEGQTVEVNGSTVLVDGQAPAVRIEVPGTVRAPLVIPRGCVFLVAKTPMADSLQYGPVPARNLTGKL